MEDCIKAERVASVADIEDCRLAAVRGDWLRICCIGWAAVRGDWLRICRIGWGLRCVSEGAAGVTCGTDVVKGASMDAIEGRPPLDADRWTVTKLGARGESYTMRPWSVENFPDMLCRDHDSMCSEVERLKGGRIAVCVKIH